MAPPEQEGKDRRIIDLVADHDRLVELNFRVSGVADVSNDHEERIRGLENTRVRKLEDQQNEWKGALKSWGIILLIVELLLNFLQFYMMRRPS